MVDLAFTKTGCYALRFHRRPALTNNVFLSISTIHTNLKRKKRPHTCSTKLEEITGVILTIVLLKSKVRDALSNNSKDHAEKAPNTLAFYDSLEEL
jgi:hypothetical protein